MGENKNIFWNLIYHLKGKISANHPISTKLHVPWRQPPTHSKRGPRTRDHSVANPATADSILFYVETTDFIKYYISESKYTSAYEG